MSNTATHQTSAASPANTDATAEHPRATFTSFEESTAEDWALIAPQLQITKGFVADRVIGLMRDLKFDHGGFPVDRLEHSRVQRSQPFEVPFLVMAHHARRPGVPWPHAA